MQYQEMNFLTECGPVSSVRIATELRTGRSGIESRRGRDFPSIQTDPGAYPASCKMGTGSLLGTKCGQDVPLTTHPLLVPRSWKSRAILLLPLWAVRPVTGSLYLFFHTTVWLPATVHTCAHSHVTLCTSAWHTFCVSLFGFYVLAQQIKFSSRDCNLVFPL